jgi:hypothetical protein
MLASCSRDRSVSSAACVAGREDRSGREREAHARQRLNVAHHILTCQVALGQRKMKRRPGAHRALGPHPPAVTRHDALHQREPDAGTGELRLGMQALEEAERLVVVAHVETHAVVADGIDALRAVLPAAHFDFRALPRAAELDGIGEQVLPTLPSSAARRRGLAAAAVAGAAPASAGRPRRRPGTLPGPCATCR